MKTRLKLNLLPQWFSWGIPLLILTIAFFIHYYFFYHGIYAVPLGDDLTLIPPTTSDFLPSFHWLWEQYGERRYFIPRFIVWGFFKFDFKDWNFIQIFHFMTFGMLIASLVFLFKKIHLNKSGVLFISLIFLLPITSTFAIDSYLWAILFSVNLAYIFLFLSAIFLYAPTPRLFNEVLGVFFAFLAVLTESYGLAMVSILTFFLFYDRMIKQKKWSWTPVILLGMVVFYFYGYDSTMKGNAIPLEFPHKMKFWLFLFKEAALVFGVLNTVNWTVRGFLFILLISIFILFYFKKKSTPQENLLLAVSTCLFMVLVFLAVKRGNNLYSGEPAVEGRYFLSCILLLPFLISMLLLSMRGKHQWLPIGMLVLVCLISGRTFHKRWDFSFYEINKKHGNEFLECVHGKILEKKRLTCQRILVLRLEQGKDVTNEFIYYKNIGLSIAKDLDLDYLKDLQK